MKVASTHELIEKLQAYEKENGIGAIIGIGTYCAGDRENQYVRMLITILRQKHLLINRR